MSRLSSFFGPNKALTVHSPLKTIKRIYFFEEKVTFHLQADESDPFKKWEARTRERTVHTINRLKIASDKSTIQRNTGIKSYSNPLWNYIDCHRYE